MGSDYVRRAHIVETEIDMMRLAFQLSGGKPPQDQRKGCAMSRPKR